MMIEAPKAPRMMGDHVGRGYSLLTRSLEFRGPVPKWPQNMTATNHNHDGHSNENVKN